MGKAETLYEAWKEEENIAHIFDVGALVWFAKIIEWEFPNFEVDKYLKNLYKAQKILERNGVIQGRTHRFYLAARNAY